MVRLIFGLAALVCSCAESPPSELGEDEFRRLVTQEGMHVDSVGVRDLAQGDTLVDYSPLVVIERTVRFPREAEGGEVFALRRAQHHPCSPAGPLRGARRP